MSRIVLLDPKLPAPPPPPSEFRQSSKFLGHFDEKRAAATSLTDSERVLRIKTKVWASQNKKFLSSSCESGHPGL